MEQRNTRTHCLLELSQKILSSPLQRVTQVTVQGKKNKVLSQAGNWQKETKPESLITFEHGQGYLPSSQRLASIFFQFVIT